MKTICVYCGSSSGNNPLYTSLAQKLAHQMHAREYSLIYGGGNLGLMGVLAQQLDDLGGGVTGYIPRALHLLGGNGPGETVLTDTMHDRKALMSEMADAFIALPGGFGTMEELVEAITWSQIRIHNKPVGVLNINGFFDYFVQWMDNAVSEGFIDKKSRQLVVVEKSVEALLYSLEHFQDPFQGANGQLSKESWLPKTSDII